MRNIINLIESVQKEPINEIAELYHIEDVFKKEFWHCISKTPESETWEHMDDPSIGRYHVYLDNGNITHIDYKHPMSSIFNRTFNTTGSFIKHLSETTDEDISDEDMAKGTSKLRYIADQLRRREKDEDNE